EHRENVMIAVTIGDVVAIRYEDGIRCVILLLDERGERALPIWISPLEAENLGRGLYGLATARPLTFNFMASLLEASGAQLDEVRVDTLKDNVYYAVAKVHSKAGTREIDARPSDALSLAVLTHSPMFVSPEIPEHQWITSTTE